MTKRGPFVGVAILVLSGGLFVSAAAESAEKTKAKKTTAAKTVAATPAATETECLPDAGGARPDGQAPNPPHEGEDGERDPRRRVRERRRPLERVVLRSAQVSGHDSSAGRDRQGAPGGQAQQHARADGRGVPRARDRSCGPELDCPGPLPDSGRPDRHHARRRTEPVCGRHGERPRVGDRGRSHRSECRLLRRRAGRRLEDDERPRGGPHLDADQRLRGVPGDRRHRDRPGQSQHHLCRHRGGERLL